MALRKGQKINRAKGYHSGVRREDVAMFGTAAFLLRKRYSPARLQSMSEKMRAHWAKARERGLKTLGDL